MPMPMSMPMAPMPGMAPMAPMPGMAPDACDACMSCCNMMPMDMTMSMISQFFFDPCMPFSPSTTPSSAAFFGVCLLWFVVAVTSQSAYAGATLLSMPHAHRRGALVCRVFLMLAYYTLSLLEMLAVMSFSAPLFIAVVAGHTVGFAVWASAVAAPQRDRLTPVPVALDAD